MPKLVDPNVNAVTIRIGRLKEEDSNIRVQNEGMPKLVDPNAPQLDAFNPNINQP